MSRTFILAGLLIDSWRDQLSQAERSEINMPAGVIPISLLRGTSDDVPSTPRLMSRIALRALKWEPR
jgi:hypothetical protein